MVATPEIREGTKSFAHGVHPPEEKAATASLPSERLPFPKHVVLPLSQHIGAPSVPLVKRGDRVARGQLIAKPRGFISTALHASVSGRVEAVERRLHPNGKMEPAIVIETDPWDDQAVDGVAPADPSKLTTDEVVRRVQRAGLVGLGGAAFPSHVKLAVPEGKRINAVVLNGCECEPYLTCDHRVMVERPESVIRGCRLMMAQVGAERGYIGVELNKADAIAALREIAGPEVTVVALDVKYPQGAEKMLLQAIFEREVPTGALPLDLELLVHNVGTAVALVDLFERGVPLVERLVTVTGPAIARPANVVVPIGTLLRDVVEHCGGLRPGTRQVVLGGPMMGMAQKSLEVPILKGTSGVLCLDTLAPAPVEYPCIRCGRCVEACPMFLNPARLAQLARAERPDELERYHLMSCFECASCSFVCPSGIPLVQWMRFGKALVRNQT